MRVISGRFKGHKLAAFDNPKLRPTTDRVKESIFNKISPYIEGARVIDLFSGTGNLAIESLSRGASEVVLVEMSEKSLNIAKKNLNKLNINKEIKVVKADVLKFFKNYKAEPFDVILIDPPFTKKIAHTVMEGLLCSNLYHKNSKIIIESSTHESIEDKYDFFTLWSRNVYGDKILSLYHFEE